MSSFLASRSCAYGDVTAERKEVEKGLWFSLMAVAEDEDERDGFGRREEEERDDDKEEEEEEEDDDDDDCHLALL